MTMRDDLTPENLREALTTIFGNPQHTGESPPVAREGAQLWQPPEEPDRPEPVDGDALAEAYRLTR